MASGRDGPIPYKAMGSNWRNFVDESNFPSNIGLRDPCRYSTDDTNQILKLWRERQEKGEIPFKFNFILGRSKELEFADYTDGIFDGLRHAGSRLEAAAHHLSDPLEGLDDRQDEEEEDDGSDDEPPLRRRRAELSEDEDELEARNGQKGMDIDKQKSSQDHLKKPTVNRRQVIFSEEENETPQATPRPRVADVIIPRCGSPSTSYRGNSSPTLAGSSPMKSIHDTSKVPVQGGSRRHMALLTPEPSETPILTTPGRELRPRKNDGATVMKGNKVRKRGK